MDIVDWITDFLAGQLQSIHLDGWVSEVVLSNRTATIPFYD